MKVLILAAGYATRLYPLTLNQPKPLLPVAGKPMIEYVIDSLSSIEGLDEIYVVTNAKFAPHFEKWKETRPKAGQHYRVTIINDRSTDDANKLGAIGDLNFVLQQQGLNDDLIVVAGDNLFSEKLSGFGAVVREKRAPILGVYDVRSTELCKKYSTVEVDNNSRITRFEEKPPNPSSTLIGIALYYYPQRVLPLIQQYVKEGNNPDQPGRFVQWLYPREPVYAWTVPGVWYDIGSKETLEEADRLFRKQ